MTIELPHVEVMVYCDRAQREVRVTIPETELAQRVRSMRNKSSYAAQFEQIFAEHTVHDYPDLVVFYKGKHVILNNVLAKNESRLVDLLRALTRSSVFGYTKRKRGRKKTENGGKREHPSSVNNNTGP